MLALGPFVFLPSLALAQEGGRIQGLVTDNTRQTIEQATVIVSKFATSDRIEIQTSNDGRYVHVNLPSGLYTVTAAKDELGSEMFRIRVRDGHTVEVNFALEPGRRVATWLTEAGEREELSRAFSAGVQASRSGAFDQAIDEFRRTVELSPTCFECNYNLAVAYAKSSVSRRPSRCFDGYLRSDKTTPPHTTVCPASTGVKAESPTRPMQGVQRIAWHSSV